MTYNNVTLYLLAIMASALIPFYKSDSQIQRPTFDGVHPSIAGHCKETPSLTLTAAVLLMHGTGKPLNIVLYSAQEDTFFVVKKVTFEDGLFRAGKSFAVKRPPNLPFKPTTFLVNPDKVSTFMALQGSGGDSLYPIHLNEKDEIVIGVETRSSLVDKMFKTATTGDTTGSSVKAAIGIPDITNTKVDRYLLLVETKDSKNFILHFNPTGDIQGTHEVEKGLISLLSATVTVSIAFREPMLGVITGSTFKDKEFESNYFLLQELIGCPPSPCFKDEVTAVTQWFDGSHWVLFNSWYFKYKGLKIKPMYSSASKKKINSDGYIFYGPRYYRSSFTYRETVYIDQPKELLVISSKERTDISKDTGKYKDLNKPRSAFYLRNRYLYYVFDKRVKVYDLEEGRLQGKKKQNIATFLPFDPWKNHHLPQDFPFKKYPLKGVYEEKDNLYLIFRNMYYKIPLSTFNDTGHSFSPNAKMSQYKRCFAEFLGCFEDDSAAFRNSVVPFLCQNLPPKSFDFSYFDKKGTGVFDGSKMWIIVSLVVGVVILAIIATVTTVLMRMKSRKSQYSDSKSIEPKLGVESSSSSSGSKSVSKKRSEVKPKAKSKYKGKPKKKEDVKAIGKRVSTKKAKSPQK